MTLNVMDELEADALENVLTWKVLRKVLVKGTVENLIMLQTSQVK